MTQIFKRPDNPHQQTGMNMGTMEKLIEPREGETVETIGAPVSEPLKTVVPGTLMQKLKKGAKGNLIPTTSISVRPYIPGGTDNMGLQNYGMVLFPGTAQEEQLACIERNGILRYITGLDEFAPEVQLINDADMKAAVISNIRVIVADLEKRLATNVIKIEDEDFWNKVKILKPDNFEFWSKITFRCTNDPVFLDPKKDPYDLIKYMAIEAGGFDIIAKSFEDATTKSKPPKFYLDKEEDTIAIRTEYKKLRNQAIAVLEGLRTKDPKRLLYITKCLDINSAKYKLGTPLDILYDTMDEYIQGNGTETNKTRAAKSFVTACDTDLETLKMRAMVKDAAFYKIVSLRNDGMIYHSASGTMLGKNVSEVVEYLKNPLRDDVYKMILADVEAYWK